MNIIADIAGEFDALMRLTKKMPRGKNVLVGDIIDRGPQSKEVVEWAMENSTTIMANHEHMMVDSYLHRSGNFYQPLLWETYNGGFKTILSYCPGFQHSFEDICHGNINWRTMIPAEHIKWMGSNSPTLRKKGLLVSHACKHADLTIEEAKDYGPGFYNANRDNDRSNYSFLWNITHPKRIEGVVQIFGHKANEKTPRFYSDEFPEGTCDEVVDDAFAIGIDCSFGKVLTGIHWPSLEVFQEPYVVQ